MRGGIPEELQTATTRRTIVATGAKLAYAAPLVAASFKVSGVDAQTAMSPGGGECPPTTGDRHGRVVDADTGEGIAGAHFVMLGGIRDVTDREGFFTLRCVGDHSNDAGLVMPDCYEDIHRLNAPPAGGHLQVYPRRARCPKAECCARCLGDAPRCRFEQFPPPGQEPGVCPCVGNGGCCDNIKVVCCSGLFCDNGVCHCQPGGCCLPAGTPLQGGSTLACQQCCAGFCVTDEFGVLRCA